MFNIYIHEWMDVFYYIRKTYSLSLAFFGLVQYKEIIWIWNGFTISKLHEYSMVDCWFVVYLSVCSCIEALGDDTTLVTDSMLENMKKIDRCLRVLENVRYHTYCIKLIKHVLYSCSNSNVEWKFSNKIVIYFMYVKEFDMIRHALCIKKKKIKVLQSIENSIV